MSPGRMLPADPPQQPLHTWLLPSKTPKPLTAHRLRHNLLGAETPIQREASAYTPHGELTTSHCAAFTSANAATLLCHLRPHRRAAPLAPGTFRVSMWSPLCLWTPRDQDTGPKPGRRHFPPTLPPIRPCLAQRLRTPGLLETTYDLWAKHVPVTPSRSQNAAVPGLRRSAHHAQHPPLPRSTVRELGVRELGGTSPAHPRLSSGLKVLPLPEEGAFWGYAHGRI